MNFCICIFILKSTKSEFTSLKDFIKKTSLAFVDLTNIHKEILKNIYEVIKYEERDSVVLFMAAALHNTSFLNKFVDNWDKGMYKTRGLLEIQGFEKYQTLSTLSTRYNYVENYEMLGAPVSFVIKDCYQYFLHVLKLQYTFENYCQKMGLGEYEKIKNRRDILRFKSIYDVLTDVY
ncbi:hypothetical protein NCER_101095 [Vairimorpha ceranae BRL01]|uniref:Uncharacterized protein n=2 Tax=Vairimorpha ceranae TaxID=40302 RepID=C4V979_VAIC1|nr:hypothetical protein AAJ76_580007776 [Vairimorpha ceranae]EEQ82221.1 hypothetical protein NCER_101095 [Vairimorpha ceranae BRL01]KAF5141086.1 hypothetical protein G9O61_00g007770 [Vairimorpha ceranae]KKO74584.1 hypothetical protein AAJ76_580007776 [Vairimorpha ceranae]